MKRLLLLYGIILCTLCAYATPRTIYQGLTLDESTNKYYLHFVMPEYDVVTDTFTVDYGGAPLNLTQLSHAAEEEYYFSRIKPKEYDDFSYLSVDGRPELPFYSLNLLLPLNNTWYDVVNIDTISVTSIVLPYEYTPSQAGNDLTGDFSYDVTYYGIYDDTWYWDYYAKEDIQYRFANGFLFSIFPCHYEPSTRTLTVVNEITFEIEYNGFSLDQTYLHDMLDTDRSIYFYFSNFIDFPEPYLDIDDTYLIITADEWENNPALEDFVDHKEALGYTVEVVPLRETGYTAGEIRTYIKMHYEAYHTKFVLLIGDIPGGEELPFSNGINEHMSDPPTDTYYACLSKNDTCDQWMDLTPTVFIGRWPIPHGESDSLRNIVDKTIASDLYLWDGLEYYGTSKMGLFSGRDDGAASLFFNSYFNSDCRYIYNNIVQEYSYYSGDFINGSDASISLTTMKNYLESSDGGPTWMFVYDGHGSDWRIPKPYFWRYDSIYYISTSGLDFQPFGFGFACLLGNIFEDKNFARSWITSRDGGVTFLGATTNTTVFMDKYFSRMLFNQLKGRPNMTIGEFVGNAKAKYYNPDKVVWRLNEAKKYVLFGDPSLYLFGLHFNRSSNSKPDSRKVGENKENIENITSVQIFSITGQLLRKCYTNKLDLGGLLPGIYTIVFYSDDKIVTTKKIVL